MSQQLIVELHAGRRVVAHYDGFQIETDQSVASGGDGTAPEPFDLFLASLGTCTGAYVTAFCRQRQIPTDGIRIVQSWERGRDKRLESVDIAIELPPEFPARYRSAVMRAAEQCTVKKVLADPPQLRARIVTDA